MVMWNASVTYLGGPDKVGMILLGGRQIITDFDREIFFKISTCRTDNMIMDLAKAVLG
jgi:hypothetical protein